MNCPKCKKQMNYGGKITNTKGKIKKFWDFFKCTHCGEIMQPKITNTEGSQDA